MEYLNKRVSYKKFYSVSHLRELVRYAKSLPDAIVLVAAVVLFVLVSVVALFLIFPAAVRNLALFSFIFFNKEI